MARVLKRPMFRRGGSTNDGIMSGLVDREQKSTGDLIGRARELTPELESLLREFTPKTRLPLGAVGAALVQGTPIRDALTAGYTDFTKRDDAREAAIRSGAAKLGIGQAMKEGEARAKGTSKFLKSPPPDRIYQDLLKSYTDPKGQVLGKPKTIEQLYPNAMAELGSYILSNVRNNPSADKIESAFLGPVPHQIDSRGNIQFLFERMNAGGIYFKPDTKKFYQRDSEKNILIEYDPYTFKKLREISLQKS